MVFSQAVMQPKLVPFALLLACLLSLPAMGRGPESELADAESFLRNGEESKAIGIYQNLKETYSNQKTEALARLALGNLFLVKKDFTAAKNEFFSVIRRFPRSDQTNEALFGLARAEFSNQRYKAARLLLAKIPAPVYETMPDRAPAVLALAYRNAVALEDKAGALLALDGMMTIGSRADSSDQPAKLLARANGIVNLLTRRDEVEGLRDKVKNDSIQDLLSARLGEGSRTPASHSRSRMTSRSSNESHLWLATGLSMLSTASEDRASGARANLASNLAPAFRLNFALGLAKQWELFTAADLTLIKLLAPTNRTLVGESQMDLDFGLGVRGYLTESRRVSLALELGLAREVLLRSTALTELTVDNVFLPRLSLQAGAEAIQWAKGGMGLEGELGYLLGKTSDTQSISSGLQFLGRLYTRFLLGQSSQLKVSLTLAESQLSTTYELRNNDSLGLQAGVGFRL